jgi:hypothetical protein
VAGGGRRRRAPSSPSGLSSSDIDSATWKRKQQNDVAVSAFSRLPQTDESQSVTTPAMQEAQPTCHTDTSLNLNKTIATCRHGRLHEGESHGYAHLYLPLHIENGSGASTPLCPALKTVRAAHPTERCATWIVDSGHCNLSVSSLSSSVAQQNACTTQYRISPVSQREHCRIVQWLQAMTRGAQMPPLLSETAFRAPNVIDTSFPVYLY